jgi:adenylate kinase
MPNQIFLLTGISGVGKGTVIKNARGDFKHVNFGDVMLATAKTMKLAESRDDLKKLNPKQQEDLQKATVEALKAMPGKILVDTHLALESPHGFIAGIPDWIARQLNVKRIIIIEAPSEEIIKRRAKDVSIRARESQSASHLDLQRDMDRMAGMTLSVITGAPLKIITNLDAKKAGDELSEMLSA